jgi:pSer/pThr/pTyr-binding forkhead associated (FHA) protein
MKSKIFIIGSNPNVTENEIAIKLTDPNNRVSNSHCKIIYDGINFYIEDLDSTNGTYVDENKITTTTKINYNNVIKLGEDFLFSLMNPIIQNNVSDNSKPTGINEKLFNTKKQSNKLYRNDFISISDIMIAIIALILSIVLDLNSVFFTNENFATILISLISGLLYVYGFSLLIKYFKIFKEKVIIKYLNWTVTLFILVFFINFLIEIIEIGSRDEIIVGILPILIYFASFIIIIILSIEIIKFDKDKTGHLRQFAFLQIISLTLMFIINFFEEENNTSLELVTTILEIIPTIFLILFFYKLKNIESFTIESENNIVNNDSIISNQIKQLFDLKEQGVISDEEFNNKKKELLDKI